MRKIALATFALALSVASAFAQNVGPGEIPHPGAGAYNAVAPTCTSGQYCTFQTDINGQLKVVGAISASLTGFPTVQTTGTPISVTTGGVTGTLPAGAVVVASNVGLTNTAYCKLGASATTADQPILPGSWFAFTVGANTQLTCITSTSTTTVNMVGGSGLPTGAGGGAGGGGSSSITNWGGGVLGAMANYGTSPGAVLVPGVNAFVTNTTPLGQALPTASSPVVTALQSIAGGATFVSGTTAAMTGTTSTQIIALVASNRIYVTRIKCNNSSGTATLVQIRDGVAGTVLDTLAAGATYGGEQGTGPTPLFWTTAGTALYAQNVTTSASVICTASGYSGL